MKNIKLFTAAYLVFFVLFTSFVFAQSSNDLTGVFEGLRKQYDPHHRTFIQEFQYKYDLKQDGDQVYGVSTIFSESGDYADVKIRGMVVGDKFYFEEYQIIDEIKSPYSVWCYKTGELNITRENGMVMLSGETQSYMSNYGAPCTGGYTEILKMDDSDAPIKDASKLQDAHMRVDLYPNPTEGEAQIYFELNKKNKVKVELFDLSGRLIATPLDGSLGKGIHQTMVNVEKESTGLFIVKLTVGDQFYSKELIKTAK